MGNVRSLSVSFIADGNGPEESFSFLRNKKTFLEGDAEKKDLGEGDCQCSSLERKVSGSASLKVQRDAWNCCWLLLPCCCRRHSSQRNRWFCPLMTEFIGLKHRYKIETFLVFCFCKRQNLLHKCCITLKINPVINSCSFIVLYFASVSVVLPIKSLCLHKPSYKNTVVILDSAEVIFALVQTGIHS